MSNHRHTDKSCERLEVSRNDCERKEILLLQKDMIAFKMAYRTYKREQAKSK